MIQHIRTTTIHIDINLPSNAIFPLSKTIYLKIGLTNYVRNLYVL